MNLYKINPRENYLKQLAEFIFNKCDSDFARLSEVIIILPTKRASQHLKKYFCEISEGGAAIMPKIIAIGEGDEEQVNINKIINNNEIEGENKKIVAKESRILSTAEFIIDSPSLKIEGLEINFEQSLKLAKSLLELLDNFKRYDVEYKALEKIFPEELASHKQNSIEFIKSFFEFYEGFFKGKNLTDVITKRNLNIKDFTNNIKALEQDIFICGTTGTIPSTKKLVREIIKNKKGHFILPYIDESLSDSNFEEIIKNEDRANHQYHIAELLSYLKVKLQDIDQISGVNKIKASYVSEVMQPAAKIYNWGKSNVQITNTPNIITANNQLHEAELISLIIREKLEDNKNIAVITNNRLVAKNINILLKKYEISADYSFGNSLNETLEAKYILQICNLITNNFENINLLDLLKNSFCKFSDDINEINILENKIIRKFNIRNFENLINYISKNNPDLKVETISLLNDINVLKQEFNLKYNINFQDIIKFVKAIHNLLQKEVKQNERLEKISEVFDHLQTEIGSTGTIERPLVSSFINEVLSQETIRENFYIDNKVTILSSIEARMMYFDCAVLAGMNQDIWPQNKDNIWLNETMLKTIGLPDKTHFISSSAHDFASMLHMPEVYLSYSKNIDGEEATKSQFLNRLEIYFEARKQKDKLQVENNRLNKLLDALKSKNIEFIERNKIYAKRDETTLPRKISATQIEKTLDNPYEYYAKEILRLYEINGLEQEDEVLDYGNFIHEVIEKFTNLHQFNKQEISINNLTDIAAKTYQKYQASGLGDLTWLSRITSFAPWFCEIEKAKAPLIERVYSEIKGELELKIKGQKFRVKAKLDRIELYKNGYIKIVDFKTGSLATPSEVKNLKKPQLPIEGLIAKIGNFEDENGNLLDFSDREIEAFEYYGLKNSAKGFEIVEIENNEESLSNCQEQLESLIEQLLNDNTKYLTYPEESNNQNVKYSNYLHLMRFD